jgi:hypothetical protein
VALVLPVLPVVPVIGLRLPQATPDAANRTVSPETGAPLAVVTVAVTVEVVEPSAGTLEGLAATVIAAVAPLPVWVMVTALWARVLPSMTVIEQNPGTIEDR